MKAWSGSAGAGWDQRLQARRKDVYLPANFSIMMMKNAISWFEIPVTDLDRAQKFYEAIFGIQMIPMDNFHVKMRLFPIEDPMTGIGGALALAPEFYKPSATDGPMVYLNANPDVQGVLDKVGAAGGTIVVPRTEISPEYGYFAIFIDTEGNRVALHSVPPPKG